MSSPTDIGASEKGSFTEDMIRMANSIDPGAISSGSMMFANIS